MGTAWRPLPLGIDMACMHASWCLLVRCERYEGTFHILLVKLAAKAARAGRTVLHTMATETSAIGDPPTWSWSLDAPSQLHYSDPAAMLEEGWAYLRQIFLICFSGAQRISAADMRALCGTIAALHSCGGVPIGALDLLVQAQLRETMRRSAAGIDRLLPGPPLRAAVLARWTQLRAWSIMWQRVFGYRIIDHVTMMGNVEMIDAEGEFARAITARLQPSGLARACLGDTAYTCDGPSLCGGHGCTGGFSSCACRSSPVFLEVVAAAGSSAEADALLGSFERGWREAARELRRRLDRWRRITPLVGRWRRFLMLLHDEVHYRPANPGQKRCRDEFAALAAGGTTDAVS